MEFTQKRDPQHARKIAKQYCHRTMQISTRVTHLAADRVDTKHSVSMLMQGMANSRVLDELRANKFGRYLIKCLEMEWVFDHSTMEADADRAGEELGRASCDGGFEFVCGKLLDGWSTVQTRGGTLFRCKRVVLCMQRFNTWKPQHLFNDMSIQSTIRCDRHREPSGSIWRHAIFGSERKWPTRDSWQSARPTGAERNLVAAWTLLGAMHIFRRMHTHRWCNHSKTGTKRPRTRGQPTRVSWRSLTKLCKPKFNA